MSLSVLLSLSIFVCTSVSLSVSCVLSPLSVRLSSFRPVCFSHLSVCLFSVRPCLRSLFFFLLRLSVFRPCLSVFRLLCLPVCLPLCLTVFPFLLSASLSFPLSDCLSSPLSACLSSLCGIGGSVILLMYTRFGFDRKGTVVALVCVVSSDAHTMFAYLSYSSTSYNYVYTSTPYFRSDRIRNSCSSGMCRFFRCSHNVRLFSRFVNVQRRFCALTLSKYIR